MKYFKIFTFFLFFFLLWLYILPVFLKIIPFFGFKLPKGIYKSFHSVLSGNTIYIFNFQVSCEYIKDVRWLLRDLEEGQRNWVHRGLGFCGYYPEITEGFMVFFIIVLSLVSIISIPMLICCILRKQRNMYIHELQNIRLVNMDNVEIWSW